MARFVFGMGIALINHWKIIKKNFNPDYGIDNDKSKWGKSDTYTNLTCIAPEKLYGQKDAEALITVGSSLRICIFHTRCSCKRSTNGPVERSCRSIYDQ